MSSPARPDAAARLQDLNPKATLASSTSDGKACRSCANDNNVGCVQRDDYPAVGSGSGQGPGSRAEGQSCDVTMRALTSASLSQCSKRSGVHPWSSTSLA